MAKITPEEWEKVKLSEAVPRTYIEFTFRLKNGYEDRIRFGFGSSHKFEDAHKWEFDAMLNPDFVWIARSEHTFATCKNILPYS